MNLQTFSVFGLFGTKDITLDITGPALILVGQNGIGKSSVANLFYFLISRQWDKILQYEFTAIRLNANDNVLYVTRDEIIDIVDYNNTLLSLIPTQRYRDSLKRLNYSELTKLFGQSISTKDDTSSDFGDILGMSQRELRNLRATFSHRFQNLEDKAISPERLVEQQLSECITAPVLYLPTYRRIEKDIKEIFPDFEDRYRKYATEFDLSGRHGTHFSELVSFGMEDVQRTLSSATQVIRDYSLAQYNNLSGLYLRDVIRDNASFFDHELITSLSEERISSILARVNEQTLPSGDKRLLREKISSIQGHPQDSINQNDRYLAHYFSRLVKATDDIAEHEKDISEFVNAINNYLRPAKHMSYNEITYSIEIFDDADRPIDLKHLSSGEKQVVSLFCHLYLESTKEWIVVIDEPELSLSVPWQKRFLRDIVDSGRCPFMLAVTHSPFVYDNSLRANAVDLRKLTTRSKQ